MTSNVFRVHPAIGIGRVGDSQEFYLAPVTAAGTRDADGLFGGLPVQPGTESTPITERDFRDAAGNVKRQAARFHIYAYPSGSSGTYPNGGGVRVDVGSTIDGKTVKDIVWTVHLANKKLNNYSTVTLDAHNKPQFIGIEAYGPHPKYPPRLRNPDYAGSSDPNNPVRLLQLVIDPGPRAISAASGNGAVVAFDMTTTASYADASGTIRQQPDYPVSFPSTYHADRLQPLGELDSLGDIRVELGSGALIVAGGFARTVAVKQADGKYPPLNDPTENGLWYDDAADGPVNAVLIFTDGSTASVQGAWYVTGDPGYAPQTRNVVSTWDDVYDVWVRELQLVPSLYDKGQFLSSYTPSFSDDIQPIFHAAMLQRWNTNLPSAAIKGHDTIGQIQPTDDPTSKIPNLTKLIRDPASSKDTETGSPMMPLSLGDAQKSFLSVSSTQYFLLNQWHGKHYAAGAGPTLGPGELLDRVTLQNCLGGRYSPGIEVSFPIRDVNLYVQDWKAQDCGPFRINQAPLDYSKANQGSAFLSFGYVPLQTHPVEPGDLSKFMSVPWHTDYNSCATHLPDPNPGQQTVNPNNTLFWSWPAERPFAVYPAALCQVDPDNNTWYLGPQVYSVRGVGTDSPYPTRAGRFQAYADFVANWAKVGFVVSGSQIAPPTGKPDYPADMLLEVASQFDPGKEFVAPWPMANMPVDPNP
ncbi:LodA/GoxA family CTQ-dependent oxidase [Xanthomonas sacchari]|uniref:LodA/GoxA family CTQ-dependent oxidase n=1 Tax=Xanthomonas sacchari TaxID=56458 RepID=UPI00224F4266|nr:LodA/GoxA family CTQ-dependent oxidase [Xanthomonas sacchari]MCW0464459.1 L-lysine 6-oxidase [Xanthomonas sacchari]